MYLFEREQERARAGGAKGEGKRTLSRVHTEQSPM